MKRLLILAILFLLATPSFGAADSIISTVCFQDPQGNCLANGLITFNLNIEAKVIAGGQVAPPQVNITLDANGKVPAGTVLYGNDQLQPTGTFYNVRFYNSNGLLVSGNLPLIWVISGASPVDLSLIVASSGSPDPGLANPVLQNPSAAQTVTGQSLTFTSSAPVTMQGNLTVSGTGTLKNANAALYVDGTANTFATIQAALAAVPAGGAEVHVTAGSTATWNGGAIPSNTTLIFDSANASYVVTGPITLGSQSHIICKAGQSTGLTGQNQGTTVTAGTILNFTGNLTGSQDAISATGNNNNDGVSVEGCWLRMGGSGRAGIHFSGINGSRVLNTVIADPGTYGYWLDAGSASGSHAYGNLVIQTDVIHSVSEGYRLSVDPAGTGVGGDMDRTTFIDAEYHPRDVGGAVSSGQGFHLLVPSTASATQTIANFICTSCFSNGSATNTYAMKLENAKAAAPNAMITDITIVGSELEEVYGTTQTGSALTITDLAAQDIQHVYFRGGLTGPGFTTATNINASTQNVADYFFSNGNPLLNTNAVNLFDVVTFLNNYSATASCNGTQNSPGIRWGTSAPGPAFLYTSDNILHYYRCDTAVDQWKVDLGNTQIIPATNNTWKLGNHSTSEFTEIGGFNIFAGSTLQPNTAAGADVGNAAIPFGNLWLGTAATNNFKFQPAATAAARVISMPDPLSNVQLGESLNTGTSVYQSKRGVAGCTTAASIGGTCASDITVTWTTAFADANYSVTCTGSTPTAVPAAPFVVSGTKLAATVHINYFAITAVAASYATIDCVAIHD